MYTRGLKHAAKGQIQPLASFHAARFKSLKKLYLCRLLENSFKDAQNDFLLKI